jgi:hypothetical protein
VNLAALLMQGRTDLLCDLALHELVHEPGETPAQYTGVLITERLAEGLPQ